jgi:hypothetical protein
MAELSVCDGCGATIVDHVHSLFVQLNGWGDRGIIDTYEADGGVAVELCELCARPLLETRWGANALPYLNINVGHVCAGTLSWVPQPGCERDPDRHGWRPVFVVRPDADDRRERGAGKLAHFGMFADEPEAERFATEIRRIGIPVRVVRSLIGNERNFGMFVDPDDWVAQHPVPRDASGGR